VKEALYNTDTRDCVSKSSGWLLGSLDCRGRLHHHGVKSNGPTQVKVRDLPCQWRDMFVFYMSALLKILNMPMDKLKLTGRNLG
jgi:hypothetical protein